MCDGRHAQGAVGRWRWVLARQAPRAGAERPEQKLVEDAIVFDLERLANVTPALEIR